MVLTILTFYMKLRPKMAQPSPDTVGGITPTIVGGGWRKRWCLNDTNIFKVSPWRSTIVGLKTNKKQTSPAASFQAAVVFLADARRVEPRIFKLILVSSHHAIRRVFFFLSVVVLHDECGIDIPVLPMRTTS